jgi:hypothetical protein
LRPNLPCAGRHRMWNLLKYVQRYTVLVMATGPNLEVSGGDGGTAPDRHTLLNRWRSTQDTPGHDTPPGVSDLTPISTWRYAAGVPEGDEIRCRSRVQGCAYQRKRGCRHGSFSGCLQYSTQKRVAWHFVLHQRQTYSTVGIYHVKVYNQQPFHFITSLA